MSEPSNLTELLDHRIAALIAECEQLRRELEIAIAALEEIERRYLDQWDQGAGASSLASKALLDIRREQALFGVKEKV